MPDPVVALFETNLCLDEHVRQTPPALAEANAAVAADGAHAATEHTRQWPGYSIAGSRAGEGRGDGA
jgi:hypothetical protein